MGGSLKQECYNKVKQYTQEFKERGSSFMLYRGVKFVNYGAEHYDVFDTSGNVDKYSKISNEFILESIIKNL